MDERRDGHSHMASHGAASLQLKWMNKDSMYINDCFLFHDLMDVGFSKYTGLQNKLPKTWNDRFHANDLVDEFSFHLVKSLIHLLDIKTNDCKKSYTIIITL